MQAGPGSNAPHHGGSGLLPTPTPRPMMQGPRPQMARADLAGVQGGGSLGPGRPSGPSSSAVRPRPNAGRGDGGRGMPMGPGRPSGGRGGGRGAEEGGRGRVDNSMVGGGPPQGPQRSPTIGPVHVNGNSPRAFGPSGSGAPVRPHGPMAREGNGRGMGVMPRHGQQDGRPSGGADGVLGAPQGVGRSNS